MAQLNLTTQPIDPVTQFAAGPVVIMAPHMDDEVLGCGGLIAQLEDKTRVHVVFATDSSQCPVPLTPRQGRADPNLSTIRMQESRAALAVLGVPPENLHFLGYPETRLNPHRPAFEEALCILFGQIAPAYVFVPFRLDRHPEHILVNQAARAVLGRMQSDAEVLEYFIYYRWPLLTAAPGKDIRRCIAPEHLLAVDIQPVSTLKRAALEEFASQLRVFYDWQTRPALAAQFVDQFCNEPETFFREVPGVPVYTVSPQQINLIFRVQLMYDSYFKRQKDRLMARLR